MILEGVAIGLGRYPVHQGRTIGKMRTFAIVLVNTLTEKWIRSEGKYRGGHRLKVRCSPDFRVSGQIVRCRVPDMWPENGEALRKVALDDPNSEGLSRQMYIPYVVEQ